LTGESGDRRLTREQKKRHRRWRVIAREDDPHASEGLDEASCRIPPEARKGSALARAFESDRAEEGVRSCRM